MKGFTKFLFSALLSLMLLPAVAQEKTEAKPSAADNGWFVGVQGGVPFGISTFSSFGADKVHLGFTGGLYGGYRFGPVLSVEASAKWGRMNLAERGCCADNHYWLGSDWDIYNTPVLDMAGWDFSDLKTSAFIQQYGMQLNVNLLGFFNKTKYSRWTLEVAPALSVVGTDAVVKTKADGAVAAKGDRQWFLGVGGNLQVGCQVSKRVNVGLYSGVTHLICERVDLLPLNDHKANVVWENGIKLAFTFGKKGNKSNKTVVAPVAAPAFVEKPAKEPEVTVCPEEKAPAQVKEEKVETVLPEEKTPAPVAEPLSFPAVNFGFNSTAINNAELGKLQEIKKLLDSNPETKVVVNGWCDTKGSKSVNARISQKRAEAVKSWLVSKGISASRITVKGNGSDFRETDDSKARRAECVVVTAY